MSVGQQRFETVSGLEWLGHSDQGGWSDGTQVMVSDGYAYIAHPFSHGFTVVDCRNPRQPVTVGHVSCSPGSWSLSLQCHGDYLVVTEELDFFGLTEAQADHFATTTGPGGGGIDSSHSVYGGRNEAYTGGLRVYDISDRAYPRPVGFCDIDGFGLHRCWWTGGQYMYASASLDGFNDHVLVVIDMGDPVRPVLVGRFWLPGQWLAGGEQPPEGVRVALHHMLTAGDLALGAWRDAGVVVLDLEDPVTPRRRGGLCWHPPNSGNTHTTLPLVGRRLGIVADEAQGPAGTEEQKRTWVLDLRAPDNPVSIATFPSPSDADYRSRGGAFGPHNIWENRPEGLVSEDTIFVTYQNAGLRVFDITNPYRPDEVGRFVAGPPARMVDPRPGEPQVTHASDLFVTRDGLVHLIDYNGGLNILQWNGA